ncbi:hypothetical protein ACJJTC_002605 [Scirpophaga incertulas]
MTKSNQLNEGFYQIPQENQDIVDVACSIVNEDGPQPMRNLRPARKYQTAAERLDSEYQDPYEARGRQSRDLVDEVRLRSAAYPKMYDELYRRRSIAKVTAVDTKHCSNKAPIVRKRRNTNRREGNGQGSKRQRLAPHSRRRKAKGPRFPKSRFVNRTNKNRTKLSNVGCQYSISLRSIDNSNTRDNLECMRTVGVSQIDCVSDERQVQDIDCQSKNSQQSKNYSIPTNPDTTASMTSCNTLYYFDQEPMV